MNPTTARELHRSARAGNTRNAGTYACFDCGAPVLRGLDADVAAVTVSTDPNPLTTLGEVLALADGRATYELTRRAGRTELDPRRGAHICNRPAAINGCHVVTEHKCGHPLPANVHTSIPRLRYSVPDQPQF